MRTQVQTLHQQQAEQIQGLQKERNQAANRLSALVDEIERVKGNSTELLKLRGGVGMLRQQTNELGRSQQENRKLLSQVAAQSEPTNQVSAEDQFTLRQTHVVDAMTTLLTAIKNHSTNHNGQYPENFDQLTASGDLDPSNFAGNLRLDDFEFKKDGAVDPEGKKVILSIRVPLQRPGRPSVTVLGGISDSGDTHTSIWNVGTQ
jgi:hypothetical protein